MQPLVHRPSRLLGRAPHKLTLWLLGAVLVAIVAAALAVSLIGSGNQQTAPSTNAAQAAPQAPTPFGGAHQADPGAVAPQAASEAPTQWGGARR